MGAPISRRRVAADFSTSLRPAVEALIRLECDGFLEHRPRAGTRVRVPSADDIRGHYVVREALEVQAAKRFTQMATPRAREELMRLAARVDALAIHGDCRSYAGAHQKLHMRIAEGSRCRPLCEALETTLASPWSGAMRPPSAGGWSERHEALVAGVVNGDPSAAAEAVRQHIGAEMQRALESLAPYLGTHDARGETFTRQARLAVVSRRATRSLPRRASRPTLPSAQAILSSP